MMFSCNPCLDFTLRTDESPGEKKLEKAEGHPKHQSAHSHFTKPCQQPEQDSFLEMILVSHGSSTGMKGLSTGQFQNT